MPRLLWLGPLLVIPVWAQAPTYTPSSIVNAATNEPGAFAPLSLVSIYGVNLAYATKAVSIEEIKNGLLPTILVGTGVSVSIDNVRIPILFVSPGQVNAIIPGNVRPGVRRIRLTRENLAGPDVEIQIADSAPGLFPYTGHIAIAAHPDGSLITAGNPAVDGGIVVLYAAGLGPTLPAVTGLTLPTAAASIAARREFAVLLNGQPIADNLIFYAGVTPGFAGLYQINFQIPSGTPADPEIRLRLSERVSPPSLSLPVRPAATSLQ